MAATLASVTTGLITPIDATLTGNLFSVTCKGAVTNIGESAVTERGVCYGTIANPTITNSKVATGSGIGSFSTTITSLAPNVIYYIRAYATNSFGTFYGIGKTYKRVVTAPKVTTPTLINFSKTGDLISVTINNTITNDGGSTLLTKGICWATTLSPTIANNNLPSTGNSNTFIFELQNLLPNTNYYIRTYASNFFGITYSTAFIYKNTVELPQINTSKTYSYRNIECTGVFSIPGGLQIIQKGFVISTLKSPTFATALSTTVNGPGTSDFTSTISALTPNTTYYIRPYFTTVLGTSYGTGIATKTKTLAAPTLSPITITPIHNVGINNQIEHFEVSATITSNGGAPIYEAGIIWAPEWMPNQGSPGQFITLTSDVPVGVTTDQDSPGLLNGTVVTGKIAATKAFTNWYNENVSDEGYTNPVIPGVFNELDDNEGSIYAKVYAKNYVGVGYSSETYWQRTPLAYKIGIQPATSFVTVVNSTNCTVKTKMKYHSSHTILNKGVCWSLNYNPTTSDSYTNVRTKPTITTSPTAGGWSFAEDTYNITGIIEGLNYYVRSYVVDQFGISYGTTCSGFNTSVSTLQEVTIGTMKWADKDLDVSTYKNGNIIPQVQDEDAFKYIQYGAWCYVNNDPLLGKLYNGYAITDSRGLAPTGWRIPTDADWTKLGTALGGNAVAGGKMKHTGTRIVNGKSGNVSTYWLSPNTGATNSSGLGVRGLPKPGRGPEFWKELYYTNTYKNYASSTKSTKTIMVEITRTSYLWSRSLAYNSAALTVSDIQFNCGFSVRCIK